MCTRPKSIDALGTRLSWTYHNTWCAQGPFASIIPEVINFHNTRIKMTHEIPFIHISILNSMCWHWPLQRWISYILQSWSLLLTLYRNKSFSGINFYNSITNIRNTLVPQLTRRRLISPSIKNYSLTRYSQTSWQIFAKFLLTRLMLPKVYRGPLLSILIQVISIAHLWKHSPIYIML